MIEMLKLSEKLLPCPFCGCKATFVKHSAGMPGTQGYDKWDAVACKHCRATVGACDRRFRCLDDAMAAWNRRATPQPAQQAREPMTGARKQKVLELFDQLQGHYNRESVGFHCIEEVKQLLGLADAATPQAGQGGEGA